MELIDPTPPSSEKNAILTDFCGETKPILSSEFNLIVLKILLLKCYFSERIASA